MLEWWGQLGAQADNDGDGEISREELFVMMEGLRGDTPKESWEAGITEIFKEFDADNSGYLDPEETALLKAAVIERFTESAENKDAGKTDDSLGDKVCRGTPAG